MMNNTRSLADRYARSRESTNVLPAIGTKWQKKTISNIEISIIKEQFTILSELIYTCSKIVTAVRVAHKLGSKRNAQDQIVVPRSSFDRTGKLSIDPRWENIDSEMQFRSLGFARYKNYRGIKSVRIERGPISARMNRAHRLEA